MTIADESLSDVQHLLETLGTTATLSRLVPGVYNPATGSTGADTISTWPCKVAFMKFKAEEIDGTKILAQDTKVLVAAKDLATAPLEGDTIIRIDGTIWTVIMDSHIEVQGIPVVHVLGVRIIG